MSEKTELIILDESKPEMLTEITNTDLQQIRERFEKSEAVVSLCLPMEKAGAETRKNHIVFKNALSEASELLSKENTEHRDLEFTLRNLSWLDNATDNFWQNQENGLLMFIDGGNDVLCARLPYTIGPDVQIGNAPNLRPLHRLTNPSRYYILALDLNELKLYEATRWKLRELELNNVPTSLAEAMKYDDPEESLQFRSSSAASGKNGPDPLYHGQGVTTDATENVKIQRFFEMVSKDIADNFPDRNTELILLGPGPELARYRETNHYENLSDHEIDVNPSNRSLEDLQKIVAAHIETLAEKNLSEVLENLESQIANEQGSADLADIMKATMSGRVETLFYEVGAMKYGKVSGDSFEVDVHDEPQTSDLELVGLCAEQAINAGARICVLEKDGLTLPDKSPIAASYRY